MLGEKHTYRTPMGDRVQVLCVEVRADLPVYDIEVVRDGDVIDYFQVRGWHTLVSEAQRRHWITEDAYASLRA